MRLSIVRIEAARRLKGFPLSQAPCTNGLLWLLDLSIGLGTGKMLAVLACDAHDHHLTPGALSLDRVHCIGGAVADSWTGESIAELLGRLIAQMGRPAAYLKDGGSDLHKAVAILGEHGCVFHGFLPPSPWECCHPVQRISATQSTGMLPSSLRHACHPRSVATLDRMISLCSLLLSMAVASAVHFFAVLPPGQQRRSSPMKRTQRPSGKAASCWSLGATRRWACLIYTDGALANVACRLRMESPFKAIL